jgi:hypothetical protein
VKRILKLLAPYFAVGIFWCVFSNAWLAMLAYHAQILLWSGRARAGVRKRRSARTMLPALPTAVTGPLLYFLLPHLTRTDLSAWLADHQVSRLSLLLMIPYFGLVHPLLEQIHWAPLREKTPAAHLLFAGYHVLVLYSLLTPAWLVLCFVALTGASLMWRRLAERTHGLAAPVASHVLADLGVIVAACLRT